MTKCKGCTKDAVMDYRTKNIDKVREYEASRGMLTHRVEAVRERAKTIPPDIKRKYSKRFVHNSPEKRAAHIIVGNAIRSGKLVKQPCEVCQNVKTQAHHDDYFEPMGVRWLCTKCHGEYHRDQRKLLKEVEKEVMLTFGTPEYVKAARDRDRWVAQDELREADGYGLAPWEISGD